MDGISMADTHGPKKDWKLVAVMRLPIYGDSTDCPERLISTLGEDMDHDKLDENKGTNHLPNCDVCP
jgi:hypothetical protein